MLLSAIGISLPVAQAAEPGFKPTYTLGTGSYRSGDYAYRVNYSPGSSSTYPDTIEIVRYFGNKRTVSVPAVIDGYRVGAIGDNAFSVKQNPEMEELRSVNIPGSIYAIGKYAFKGCKNLTRVKLNEGLQMISSNAFYGCLSLKSIDLPSTLIALCTDFTSTGISEVTVPAANDELYDRLQFTGDSLSIYGGGNLRKLTVKKNNCEIIPTSFPYEEAVFEGTVFCSEVFEMPFPSYFPSSIKTSRIVFRKGTPEDLTSKLNMANRHIDPDGEGVIFYAGETQTSQTSGDYTYILDSRGKAVITGYTGSDTEIQIPETIDGHTVIRIAEDAFKGKTAMTSVSIPDSVLSIECGAFSDCTALENVNLEEGLLSIGAGAFKNCSSLKGIALPDSLTEINESAFRASGLESIAIPENITQLKANTFRSCTALSDVTLPDGIIRIGNSCFKSCSALTGLEFPVSLETIGAKAFGYTGIKRAVIDCNIKHLEEEIFGGSALEYLYISGCNLALGYSFRNSQKLKYAETGDGVKWLQKNTFANCTSLETIKLGRDISFIGNGAFGEITSLKTVIFNCAICTTEADIRVSDLKNELDPNGWYWASLQSPFGPSEIENVIFGEDVEFIATGLFANQTALTQIIIPSGTREIREVAFINCTALHTVIWNAGEKVLKAGAFWNCNALENFDFYNLSETDYKAFSINKIQSANIGGDSNREAARIDTVAEECFSENAELEAVGIGGNVKEIESRAFGDCENLETAVISDSVTDIAQDAFENCDKLTIYCTEDSPAHLFAKANGIKVTTLVIDPIPNQVFTGYEIKPEITVSCSGEALTKNLDFDAVYSDNINAGTAKVSVTGKGEFEMYASKANFTILTKSLDSAYIYLIPSQAYTGREIKPEIRMVIGGKTLREGIDFTVTYFDNVSPGTACARISGKGNYSGYKTVDFEIEKMSAGEAALSRILTAIRNLFMSLFRIKIK